MTIEKESHNLFIIFGTSCGLGNALYHYASQFRENDFIVLDHRPTELLAANTKEVIINLSKIITAKSLANLFSSIQEKRYKNIYLVNNASIVQPVKPLGKANASEIINSFNINFLNYAIIINEFIRKTPSWRNANKKILNISSGAAISAHHGLALYCSSKSALEMLTECIFEEQKLLKQVKILAFRPGIMNTDMQKRMRRSSKKDFVKVDLYKRLFKENKLLSPEEVAKKIYLVLNSNKYWQKPTLDVQGL